MADRNIKTSPELFGMTIMIVQQMTTKNTKKDTKGAKKMKKRD